MRKVLIGVFLVVPLVLVGLVLLVALNLEPLINQYRTDIEAVATKTLGRNVTFGPVDTKWDNGPSVQFNQLALSGPTPQSQPTFTLDRAVLKVDLWKALFSLGKDLQVRAFVLTQPVVRVTRNKDGSWDFQDMLDHMKARAAQEPAEPEPPPATEKDDADYKGLRIAGMAIERARLEIRDETAAKTLTVKDFNLNVSEVIPGKDVTAALTMLLDDGGGKPAPFELEAAVRPLPADLDFSRVPATNLKTRLVGVDLSPWAELLPKDVMVPSAGKVSFELKAATNAGAQNADVDGFVELAGLTLKHKGITGLPSDIRVDVDIHGDLQKKSFDVRAFNIKAPAVALNTKVRIESPSVAGIQDANVELRVTDLARVVAILPKGSGVLPPELTLEGPFEVDLKGDAAAGSLRVDLDAAHLAWADVFNKQQKTPLNLKVAAKRAGDRINLPSVTLVLDNAKLTGSASVSTKEGAPMEAALDTGLVTLASLKGVLPPVQKALTKKGTKVDGTFRLQATAKAAGEKQALHAQLDLSQVDVAMDAVTAKGGGTIFVDVAPSAASTTAAMQANLTGLAVTAKDEKKKTLVAKVAGFPLSLDVRVVQTGGNANVEKAELALGKTLIQARGSAQGLDQPAPTLDVKVEQLDIAFDDIRALAPAADVLPTGGHLKARITAAGNPQKMETLSIKVEDLNLLAAKNIVTGRAQVDNLADASFDVNLTRVDLNFDELRRLTKNDSIPKGGLLKAKVTAKGKVSQLSTLDVAVEDLDTTVYSSRVNGHVRFKDVDRPRFDIKLHGDRLAVSDILKQLPQGKEEPKPKKADEKPENPHGLPAETRKLIHKMTGTVDLHVDRVTYEKHTFDDVTALIKVASGDITFEKLQLTTYGGRVVGDGTTLDTDEEYLRSVLKLNAKNVDLGQVLDNNTSKKDAVDGRVDFTSNVTARGMNTDDVLNTLQGPVGIKSRQLTLNNANLLAGIAGPIAKVASMAGKLSGKAADPKAPTTFKDFDADLTFEGGKMVLTHPILVSSGFGNLSLDGYVRFDSRINFVGATELTPATVAQMTGNKFTPKNGVKVPVRIGGTWNQPSVEGVDVAAFLQGAGIGDLAKVAQAAAEEARKRLEEEAAKAREEGERIKKEAEARAAKEARRVQAIAQQKGEEARKLAEEQRKRAEDEAKKRAQEAKQRAEDEAKKQVDNAKKKAEDEAKRKAAEAKKKAEEGLKNLFK